VSVNLTRQLLLFINVIKNIKKTLETLKILGYKHQAKLKLRIPFHYKLTIVRILTLSASNNSSVSLNRPAQGRRSKRSDD